MIFVLRFRFFRFIGEVTRMVCMSNLIKIILSCGVFLLFIEDFSLKQDLNKALTYVIYIYSCCYDIRELVFP